MISDKTATSLAMLAGSALVLLLGSAIAAEQARYPSPDEAVNALIEAVGDEEPNALIAVLGPEGTELSSGDPVADARERKRFVEAAQEATQIEPDGDDFATLSVGSDKWPFPIPLVKGAGGWRFDTAAGIEELLDRRIGRNELNTIAVARELVEAQFEYESQDRNGDGRREFAQKLMSTQGARDGLYWPAADDEQESPLGRLVATAVAEGYEPGQGDEPSPYYGYYYRLLTKQGKNAPGGAKSYLVDGRMTDGFALLAYPAEYGNSGIMSFLVNQAGILYQKDLGEDTAALATAIGDYNPDRSWQPVTD